MGRGRPRADKAENPVSADFFRPRSVGAQPPAGEGNNPAMEPPRAPLEQPHLTPGERTLLEAIESLHRKTDRIELRFQQFEERLSSLGNRVTTVEQKQDEAGSKMVSYEKSLQEIVVAQNKEQEFAQTVLKEHASLTRRLESAENMLRECNIRVLGIPAGEEGDDVPAFINKILSELLQLTSEDDTFFVTRAYRLPSRRSSGGPPAGTILVSLQDVSDRDRLLALARRKKEILYKGSRVLLFPDVSPRAQERKLELLNLRKKLVAQNIAASVLYPAKLKVSHRDKTYIFTEVPAARVFVDKLLLECSNP